jgi:hypothetical protein
VAALISSFGGFLVVRGPWSEGIVVGAATALEAFIVIAWQMALERPVSLGPFEVSVRALATALATLAVLSTARRWQQRALRRGFRR